MRFIEVAGRLEPVLPAFLLRPLEMLSNFVKSFVKLLLYQAQQRAKLRESAKKDEAAN